MLMLKSAESAASAVAYINQMVSLEVPVHIYGNGSGSSEASDLPVDGPTLGVDGGEGGHRVGAVLGVIIQFGRRFLGVKRAAGQA